MQGFITLGEALGKWNAALCSVYSHYTHVALVYYGSHFVDVGSARLLCFLVTNIFHFVLKGNKYNFGILIAHFVIFCFSKTYMKTMKDVGSFKVKFRKKESVIYERIYAN